MPGRLKVKILNGRHLPIMDRASELTDAFVEVKFGSITHKTDVFPKSLNPTWNSGWYTFEVDDERLQDEPLQIRILDHDTYSSHDAIGKVYIDIDPLLSSDSASALHGWFPIYDTLHGIRGEIQLSVKLELFADFNRFKKSSCGIKFICGTVVPECYRILIIQGFVEELIVSEDPLYQWIDKLRTPRATNEARQRLFSQVSGELQRRIGMKVIEMGGNAVVGYQQCFDIEGEYGIVVRAIGTVVSLDMNVRSHGNALQPATPTSQQSYSPGNATPLSESPNKFSYTGRSSSLDSDPGGVPGVTLTHAAPTWNTADKMPDISECPFFTLTEYPPNFLIHIAGVVSAHSVKLLDKIHNPDAPETRDVWWRELRQEIKSHATALKCNAIVGYKESTSICDELILLSAQGTAAVVNENFFSIHAQSFDAHYSKDKQHGPYSAAIILDSSNMFDRFEARKRHNSGSGFASTPPRFIASFPVDTQHSNIKLFQIPYHADPPFPIKIECCPLDPSVQVPEILFTTIDAPKDVHITGNGTLIHARFCRSKKKSQGASHAVVVGDIIPFIEYELHKQLYNKLKLRGMNALFGLQTRLSVGENIVIGTAIATAAYVTALPPTAKEHLTCQNVPKGSPAWESVVNIFDEELEKSKEFFMLQPAESLLQHTAETSTDSAESLLATTSSESKQSLPVSMEDPDDIEQLKAMVDPFPPKNCCISNCQYVPGVRTLLANLQTFSMFWRIQYRERAGDRGLNRGLNGTCEKMFASLWQRLGRLSPSLCICGVNFDLIVPEDDEIHVWMSGAAAEYKPKVIGLRDDNKKMMIEDLQFCLDIEDGKKPSEGETQSRRPKSPPLMLNIARPDISSVYSKHDESLHSSVGSHNDRHRQRSGSSGRGTAGRHIEIIPTSHVPGRRVSRHIGFVNMFLIRETSAVRGGDEGLPGTEPQRGTGSCWFAHRVFTETQAMLRAHVSALGGNALTSYRIAQFSLSESVAKNQALCLIHVCGDAVVCTSPR